MTDPSARIEELYANHAPMVLGICRGLLRDRSEADDALQQTFLSAQRALANGSAPRSPEAWLATIARNECLARVRARAARPLPVGDEVDAVAPDAHAAAVSREQVAGLRDALAGLPPQQREAILLREVRGFSYDEVAASLAVTTSAVESLLFRARRRLQLTLREAVTALSPVGWLGPLRELAFRIGGGGLGSPDVAKVVAVGVGAAALAGGVAVTPQLVRHGVASPPPPTTTAPARSAAPPPAAPAQVLPPQAQPPVGGTGIWFTGALGQATAAASEREPGDGGGDGRSEPVEAGGDGSSEPAESAAGGRSEGESEAPASSAAALSRTETEVPTSSGAHASGTETEAPSSGAGASGTETETPTTTAATVPATGAGEGTTTSQARTGGDSGGGGESSSGGESDGAGDD